MTKLDRLFLWKRFCKVAADSENARLRAENKELRQQNTDLLAHIAEIVREKKQ